MSMDYTKMMNSSFDQLYGDDEDIEAILVSQEEAKEILKNEETPLDIRVYLALQSFALMGEKMFI